MSVSDNLYTTVTYLYIKICSFLSFSYTWYGEIHVEESNIAELRCKQFDNLNHKIMSSFHFISHFLVIIEILLMICLLILTITFKNLI